MRAPPGLALAVALTSATTLSAQELEPRLYQNAPVGLNGLVIGYGYSAGNFLVDSSLPIEGAKASLHGLTVGYLRSIDLFGKSAKIDVVVPVSWGTFEGFVAGEFRTRKPSGIADPRFRLAVNLIGAPALSLREFSRYRQKTILAVSLQVAAPLGQYDSERLINLGANRWSFRPEVGLSNARGRFYAEMAAGAWLFTDNQSYFGSSTLSQGALYFVKGALIYNFRPGIWLAVNYGFATGGETRIDGSSAATLQRNSRIGVDILVPRIPGKLAESRVDERPHDTNRRRLRLLERGLPVHLGRESALVPQRSRAGISKRVSSREGFTSIASTATFSRCGRPRAPVSMECGKRTPPTAR